MNLGAALVLGIAGSAHCLTMCGPIAGALGCTGCSSGKRAWLPAIRASGARIGSYVVLGAIAGGLGHVLVSILPGTGFRSVARMLAAIAILVAGLSLLGFSWPSAQLERAGAGVFRLVSPRFRRGLQMSAKPWWLGFLWGLLPCGLVYTALALAIDSGTALRGALTLLVFGVATLPAPLAVGLLVQGSRNPRTHTWLRRAGGAAAVLLGLMGLGRELTELVPLELPFQDHPCCVAKGQR